MIRERVLHIGLEECVAAFAGTKWKLYSFEEQGESRLVKVEVPHGSESYVVELPYASEEEKKKIEARLRGAEFISQTIRIRSEW